jgi:hypothetical protein
MIPFQPGDSRALWELARFAKKELSPSQTFQSLSTSLHGLEAIMSNDMDVETAAQIAAGAFARDVMVSNLGQMPYESEVGKLKLEAVWGPTALQGLDGEQNVGIATTNGAIRLLHASYSLIPYLLEHTELILRAACEDIPYDDEEDAVRIANATTYGLNGSVYSKDSERAATSRERFAPETSR